jgi:RNA polymerase sigma-70 factor, ECF subfamily
VPRQAPALCNSADLQRKQGPAAGTAEPLEPAPRPNWKEVIDVPPTSVKEPAVPVPSATQYGGPLSEDRVLIERFHAGDHDAFADLYRRYHPRVLGFAVQQVRDRHLAEDLAAETFAKALAALPHLRYRGRDLDAWLITIARRLIVDHYRLSQTRQVSPAPALDSSLVDERNPEATPELTVVGRTDLLAVIGQLEPRLREVVIRRVLLDRSVEQTAADLGCHQSKVKHTLRRALRRLATLLAVEVTVA